MTAREVKRRQQNISKKAKEFADAFAEKDTPTWERYYQDEVERRTLSEHQLYHEGLGGQIAKQIEGAFIALALIAWADRKRDEEE